MERIRTWIGLLAALSTGFAFADYRTGVAEAGPRLGVVNVTEDGTDLGPDAMGNPRVTLRDAVLAFSTNATLTDVDGFRRIVFELPEGQDTIRLTSEIEIPEGSEPFEIFGLDNKTGRAVTISPAPNSGNHRFFTVRSSVSFRFLNFVGGRADGDGGAILMDPNGRSDSSRCSLLLADCSFRDNSAKNGGAVYADGLITPTDDNRMLCGVYNCTFEGNQASSTGGAFYTFDSTCFVNCTFSRNKADDFGGAFGMYSQVCVVGCTFAGNTASQGKSVRIGRSRLTVLNSLLADGNETTSIRKDGSDAVYTPVCSSVGASVASFFANGATPVTNDILGVVHVAYPPLPSNAQLRDAAEIYYDGLLENVAYQKPNETVKTALCGDAEKAQVRLGFDQLRAIRLCPTRGAIRLASGGGDATVNVEGRLAKNNTDTWEQNKTFIARVTVNYDDATANQVGVSYKTDNSGYFATSAVVDGSDGYSHNVTSLTFVASALDPASVTVTNIAVTTVPYALVASSAELVDFPEAGVVRGLETSVNSLVSEQGVVAGTMTVGGNFSAATVQGGGNITLEGVTLKGGELAWFADGVGKTCGNLDTLEDMPFAKGGLESANGTKKWTAEQDGFVQVLFVNGAGEAKVSLKVGDIWITPEAGYAVRNTNGSEARRLLWTVPVSKDQGVKFGANGGQCRCQFIPFGK